MRDPVDSFSIALFKPCEADFAAFPAKEAA
jgi:hypothetical protein